MCQLNLFGPTVLERAELICDSPKRAFWNIRLEVENETFSVIKESGIGETVLDRRRWPHADHEAALKDYRRRLKAKLRPDRKSTRIYRLKNGNNRKSKR